MHVGIWVVDVGILSVWRHPFAPPGRRVLAAVASSSSASSLRGPRHPEQLGVHIEGAAVVIESDRLSIEQVLKERDYIVLDIEVVARQPALEGIAHGLSHPRRALESLPRPRR
jgi:hypothetical protein